MIKKSFSLRVLVVSFLLLALPLLIDSFIFFQNTYYESISDAERELRAEANYRTFTLMSIQPVKQVLLRELIHLLDLSKTLENPDIDKLNKTLSETAHLGEGFQLFILNVSPSASFQIIASSDPSLLHTSFVSYRVIETILKNGEGNFIRYAYSRKEQAFVPFLYLARVIKSDQTGKPIGIIVAAANISEQLNSLLKKTSALQHIKYAVLNPDGIVFASTDPKLTGQFLDPITPARRAEIIASRQIREGQLAQEPLPVIKMKDPPFFEFIFNDQVQIAYRSFLHVGGISFMSYSAKESFFGSAVRHFLLIYSIYGMILVVGGGITYWLSSWISRPLRQLSDKMGEVSRGNLNVRFREEPLGFEINILGSIFNNTIDNLLKNIQHAEDEQVKKETYQKELAIAREVQASILPKSIPYLEGTDFAAIYLNAKDVGGDFYGYFEKQLKNGDDVVILNVGDAAGRGISACIYSLSVRSLLRSYATLYDDIGVILSSANNAFYRDALDTGMFVTLFFASFQLQTNILTYYSCGHVPAFVKRSNGELITLERSGIAMGLKETDPYKPDTIQLDSGDMVIMYTDGLIEVVNPSREPFSYNRLKYIIQAHEWKSAQELVDYLTEEVQKFTQSKPQDEEVVIVAFRIK